MTHVEMVERITNALGKLPAPIAVYYSDEKPEGAFEWNCKGPHFCHIRRLAAVRQGTPVAVDRDNPGCGGAARFLGWNSEMRPGFEYFLSHAEDGSGERYKKTPEMAKAFLENSTFIPANGRYCIFQRLSDVPEDITPEVVAIFAEPDQISGLVFLASYGTASKYAVVAPMTSGCGSLVAEPRAQALEGEPKAVLGMFDPSARPTVDKRHLTFSAPYKLFVRMVEDIPGSFLEIKPWLDIRDR